ncbi:hypothetical protein B0T25DRAFT_570889 [Lasiosphaeria hispida]|uniref:G domain-containing protein n=1 Tax=Lasiosphaeria hispida TaxID=260671 RepID=A0AAJ0HGT7_9PEZI|nr:hypothetical protein B0T25DRAFT_570889 [Lasiosphaeria hispida]
MFALRFTLLLTVLLSFLPYANPYQVKPNEGEFFNSILGAEKFKVGESLSSCTGNIEVAEFEFDGQSVLLVDTPGFDDTNLADTEVLGRIVEYFNTQYKQQVKFAGLLYLRDIDEAKMKSPDIKNLEMFRALCGTEGLENVVLVTTKWNAMAGQIELAERREQELKSGFFRPLIQLSATYARDYGTSASAREVLRQVMRKEKAFFIPIQRQMVDEGKRLDQTDAGRILQKQLLEAEANHAEALKDLKAALKDEHSELMKDREERHRLERTHKQMLEDLEHRTQAKLDQAAADHRVEVERLRDQLRGYDDDTDPFF